MTERIINIAHCGDKVGCSFKDRVSVDFSPNEVSTLQILFKELAMDAKDYGTQTAMRKMHEAFSTAYGMWEDKRRQINE